MTDLAEKTPEISEEMGISKIMARYGTILAIGLIILSIFINSLIQGDLGTIGQDSDDVIRLVQIKDYLAGQSWFHTDQYRMGLAGGTDMHWSRIPDIPIIILTHFFDVFMSQERALVWAFTVWPPLSSAILIWGCFVGAKHWGGGRTKIFTFVLLAVFLLSFYRFAPGRIDHHNLQLGFLGVSMAFALDPKLRFWSYFISGCAAAISVAIGVEVYFFVAVMCAFVAFNWAVLGARAAIATQGFGLGFAIVLILAFIGTIAPSEYGLIYCDALSLVTVTAGVAGSLGLALLTKSGQVFSLNENILRRVLVLIILGIICGAILLIQAPQCLVNPLDSLPDEVTDLWLNNISEARSITQMGSDKLKLIPFMICAPFVALILLVLDIRKDLLKRSETKVDALNFSVKLLPLFLIIAALGLTLYQVRFYPFAYIFAIIPLAGWISQTYEKTKSKNPGSVIYLAALIVSVPVSWAIPGLMLEGPEVVKEAELKDKKIAKCTSEDVIKNLKALPTGTILANSDMAGFILEKTSHRVVSGNYHRNWKGISAEIKIAVSDPAESGELLVEHDIDYLYHCTNAVGTSAYTRHNENGLTAKLSEGDIPDYLVAVSSPDLEDGDVVIYKVKRPTD